MDDVRTKSLPNGYELTKVGRHKTLGFKGEMNSETLDLSRPGHMVPSRTRRYHSVLLLTEEDRRCF